MSDQKKWTPRKWFVFAAFIVLFAGLPALSWWYLKGGLEWRKEAIAELGNYGKVRKAPVIYADGTKEDLLAGNVGVIYNFGVNPDLTAANQRAFDIAEKLYDQFAKLKSGGIHPHFRLVMISENGTSEFRSHMQKIPTYDFAAWIWMGGVNSWRTILENGFDAYCTHRKIPPYPHYFALCDTSGEIRRFYNADSDQEVGRMVEHIAILLPPAD